MVLWSRSAGTRTEGLVSFGLTPVPPPLRRAPVKPVASPVMLERTPAQLIQRANLFTLNRLRQTVKVPQVADTQE